MKHQSTTVAMFFVTLLLLPFASAISGTSIDTDSNPDESESTQVMSKFVAFGGLAPIDCSEVSGTVVAIEVSKAQNPADEQSFINDLVSAGYTVGTVDISTQAGVDALQCVDILFLSSIANNYYISGSYTTGQINIVEDFVTNGGGLFFTSDHTVFSQYTANLAARFDIFVDSNYVTESDDREDGFSYWPIYNADNFIGGPLFSGVDAIVHLAGTSFVIGQGSPLIPIVRSDDDGSADPSDAPVVAAGFYGEGCVLVTGDSNWIQDYSDGYSRQDNSQFALNGVDFLITCDPGDVEVPEFGLIGASVAMIGALVGIVLLRKK
jgi:hypothetical protein